MPRATATDSAYLARLLRRVRHEGECWIWTGGLNMFGYGQVIRGRKRWMTSRLVYTLTRGAIPDGHDICHTCDRPACINPLHLWAGTRAQNMGDCVTKRRHASVRKTHCPKGHDLTDENLYVTKLGKRNCRVCQRIRQRIRAGWPLHLAERADKTPRGERPVGGSYANARRQSNPRTPKTHCPHGHPYSGKNLYIPPGGHRKCRTCHYEHRKVRLGLAH